MSDSPEPTVAELEAHLARAFPGRTARVGPATAHAREALPELRVARLEPARAGEPWVYSTVGAWAATKEQGEGVEFVLLSPREDERHVETLSSVAYFHSFYGLDEGSVYRVARGWFFDSTCGSFFFTAPSEIAGLEWLPVGGRRIHFLRCLPVSTEEAELAKKSGQEALLTAFSKKTVNFLDPKRKSVV